MTGRFPTSTRRTFLAAAGGAAAAWSLSPLLGKPAAASTNQVLAQTAGSGPSEMDSFLNRGVVKYPAWGRITEYGTPLREAPGRDQKVIGYLPQNHTLPILEILDAEGPANNPHNRVWYRVNGGYLYTAGVQIIKPYHMPNEVSTISTQIDEVPGFWAEVIVPYTRGLVEPGGPVLLTETDEPTILYYGSSHRVIEVKADDASYLWYKIDDDKKGAKSFYALARHLRVFSEEDLSPINPGVEKKIMISLADQRMDLYENGQVVFSTLVSTGGGGFSTPKGEHGVVYKQPSRHMYSDPENEAFSDPNFFDLLGVPFNTFLTTFGHAIHGTYWHGDYGRPRSHGCVNVTPEIARYVWRWVDPVAPYSKSAEGSSAEPGTQVIVE
jgi:lipoprotein-anchoring transpeptidase ErfK/SrfK